MKELLKQLEEAEEKDQLATARFLYEKILVEDDAPENFAATLLYVTNLIDLGDLHHAKATLARIEEEIPDDIRPAFLSQRGDLHAHQGDFVEAEKDYRAADKLDTNEGEYLVFAAQAAFQQNEVARAEYLIREAIAVGGDAVEEAYGNLAGYLVAQQRYQEAIGCYKKVLEFDPENDFAQEWIIDLEQVLKLSV